MSTTLPDPPPPPASVPRGPPRLSHKKIDVTFIKGTGSFAETGQDTVKLTGLRASAQVTKLGGVGQGELQLRLFELTASKMNDLSTLGLTVDIERKFLNNQIILEAGDDDAGMSVVYHGTIQDAWIDYNAMPDVAFHVTAYSGLYEAGKPVPPTSYRGVADVATIMQGIATLAEWNFQNNGVNVKLEYSYLPGTAWEQVQRVADHANIETLLDDGTPKTLIIWPKDGVRDGEAPLVSADTGLIGYPARTNNGIIVTTRYNPSIGQFHTCVTQESGV